jgi:lipoprotein NlpI
VADYSTAIRIKPDYTDAYNNRAVALTSLGMFQEAVTDYDRVLKYKPVHPFAAIRRHLNARRAGIDEGGSLQAYAAKTGGGQWYFSIIALYLDKATPEQVLESARHNDPTVQNNQLCEAYYYIGNYHLWNGRNDQAAEMFKKCVETGVQDYLEYTAALSELKKL